MEPNKGHENLIPPVKGEIRNPKGYPKGKKNFKTILKHFLDVDSGKKHPLTDEDLSCYDALTVQLIAKGLQGDVSAIREILDRLEGKPVQKIATVSMKFEDLSTDEKREKLDKLLNG